MPFFRRAFDFTFALAGLILISPLLPLIAVAIMLEDGGPILYSQTRVGRNFRAFRLHKFRTMVTGADSGSLLTAPCDARITRVGRFLRRYKLDELPQVWNVIKGDMQLVGARPEVARYVEMFRSLYEQILRDPPGITDPATILFRHEESAFAAGNIEQQYVSEILPQKLRLSLEYSRRRNFWSDLGVIWRTAAGISIAPELAKQWENRSSTGIQKKAMDGRR
jgi:lipopolysaccharide/colanic/teichoic acid biosynthesis glycosyltransferase